MKYVNLGATGLKVSRICLGCMSYGARSRGTHGWVLEEEASRPFFRQALDAGINFFDTANVYSIGASEEITGRALKDFAKRDEIVLATKVHGKMRDDPNGAGLSRKAIMSEIDASLKRLGTDYVDLYQIHRWDAETPIEETLEALNDVVKAGKARYIGASSMWAWQFMKALVAAARQRLEPLRLHAEPPEPPLPGGGARDAAALPCRGHRRHPLVAARARPAGAAVGGAGRHRRAANRTCSERRSTRAPPTPTAGGGARAEARRDSAACRRRRSRSPGFCRSRASPRRSSAPPSRSILRMRWPRSTSNLSDDGDQGA